MAIIRNTAAMRLKGSVGNTTYYTQGRRQLARVSQNSSNYGESARRSPAQQRRRVMWANLVNFYKVSKSWMHGAFETKAANETDYNRFMSVNLPLARVALNKEQAIQGCAVYDKFIISQGSLHPIQLSRSGNDAITDIETTLTTEQLGSLHARTFYDYLVKANPWLSWGCQLSFIQYSLDIPQHHMPMLRMGLFEMTMDRNDERMLNTFAIFPYLAVQDGKLKWTQLDEDGYVAIVLSDSTSGQIKVSSQSLVPGDEEMPASYATEDVIQLAMESYGVDPEYFLQSGDMK